MGEYLRTEKELLFKIAAEVTVNAVNANCKSSTDGHVSGNGYEGLETSPEAIAEYLHVRMIKRFLAETIFKQR